MSIKKKALYYWKKYGIWPLFAGVLMGVFGFQFLCGLSNLLITTVPCSNKKINSNKYLWCARQLYFSGMGLFFIIQSYPMTTTEQIIAVSTIGLVCVTVAFICIMFYREGSRMMKQKDHS